MILSFESDKNGDARRKSELPPNGESTQSRPPAKKRKKFADSHQVGRALRSAYQQTVSEEIPQEMLDLLGKLD